MRIGRLAGGLLLGLLLAVVSGGCDRGKAESPAPPQVEPPPPPPPLAPPSGDDPFEGTWWVGAREQPIFGLRLAIRATRIEGTYSGRAVSFDWQGTESASQLFRPSRPVALTAHRGGGHTEISGPMPEVDAEGRPNGQHGHWLLELTDAPPAGGPRRMTGRLVLTDGTKEEGVAVEISREFLPWNGL